MRIRFGSKAPDIDSQIGLVMHIVFTSIKKVWDDLGAEHLVVAVDGRSWRKDFYPPYKQNRKILANKRTPEEKENDELFFGSLNSLVNFFKEKTNVSVLRHPTAEADDLIARWIHLHPNDKHVVISTDSDFLQLISKNVSIYNGFQAQLYTLDGIWDKDGKPAIYKGKTWDSIDPEWFLFEKIMRGDDGDNVMSAYPGVRRKRLIEAYDNRHTQGYAWNNLMLSKWTDHNGVEIKVKEAYDRNRLLIDLTAQPQELKAQWDEEITRVVNLPKKSQVGFHLLKFAEHQGLVRIAQQVQTFSPCFSSGYQGILKNTQTSVI